MKKLINTFTKGVAGLLFVVLLVVNVQIGSGNSFFGIEKSIVKEAKADPIYCIPYDIRCVNLPGPDNYVKGLRWPSGPIMLR
jgi:hypothetical protein